MWANIQMCVKHFPQARLSEDFLWCLSSPLPSQQKPPDRANDVTQMLLAAVRDDFANQRAQLEQDVKQLALPEIEAAVKRTFSTTIE